MDATIFRHLIEHETKKMAFGLSEARKAITAFAAKRGTVAPNSLSSPHGFHGINRNTKEVAHVIGDDPLKMREALDSMGLRPGQTLSPQDRGAVAYFKRKLGIGNDEEDVLSYLKREGLVDKNTVLDQDNKTFLEGAIKSHEISETRALPSPLRLGSHVSPAVLFHEHNMITSAPDTFEPAKQILINLRTKGKMGNRVLDGEAPLITHGAYPEFDFGRSSRLNSTQIKNMVRGLEDNENIKMVLGFRSTSGNYAR